MCFPVDHHYARQAFTKGSLDRDGDFETGDTVVEIFTCSLVWLEVDNQRLGSHLVQDLSRRPVGWHGGTSGNRSLSK